MCSGINRRALIDRRLSEPKNGDKTAVGDSGSYLSSLVTGYSDYDGLFSLDNGGHKAWAKARKHGNNDDPRKYYTCLYHYYTHSLSGKRTLYTLARGTKLRGEELLGWYHWQDGARAIAAGERGS